MKFVLACLWYVFGMFLVCVCMFLVCFWNVFGMYLFGMCLVCKVAEETELGPTADDHDDTAVAAAAHDGDDDWRAWRSPIYARCLAVVS